MVVVVTRRPTMQVPERSGGAPRSRRPGRRRRPGSSHGFRLRRTAGEGDNSSRQRFFGAQTPKRPEERRNA
jgi:hypothetical protein